MTFRSTLRLPQCSALFAAGVLANLSLPLFAGDPPVIDELVPVDSQSFPTHVEPKVPVGKALIFPVTATDPEGGPLKYTVTSSNPKIFASVRTGFQKLKVQVDHAGGASDDPAFSGVMEFAMMRDLAPTTVENIGGFAQGGYYDGLIFHRIANLDANEQPDGSYIIQGGDPKGTGKGGPGFAFNNEFHPSAIFTGRGQLAMANSPISDLTYKGTNGSQFFITLGQPRFLDFNHTIFGQLLRGWDVVEKVGDVPRTEDEPDVEVKMSSAVMEPDFSDAILLISAATEGSATITVTVTDAEGKSDTEEFTVTASGETRNTPPFLQPVANQSVAKERILGIPLRAVDLESDYATLTHKLLNPVEGKSSTSGTTAYVLGDTGYVGPLNLGIAVTQFDMSYRGVIDGEARDDDDKTPIAISVGDKRVRATAADIGGSPNVALNNVVVARYIDGDPAAQPGDFTAKIIWGDGSYSTIPDSEQNGDAKFVGTIVHDPRSPLPGAFVVTGSHNYENAGTYPVTVELTASKGQRVTLRSTAVIAPGPVRAFGRALTVRSRTITKAALATFTDESPVALSAYSARIHWGDGSYADGVVVRTIKGELQVKGTHGYADAGDYAVVVEVTKEGDANAPARAWSRIAVSAPSAPVNLPPFPVPNLIGQIQDSGKNGGPLNRIKENGQVTVSAQVLVLNGGTKTVRGAKLRFYLSEDRKLNLTDEAGPNPKDILVKAGNLTEVDIPELRPGNSIRYAFTKSGAGDYRLKFPKGEGGEGLNVLAHFAYSDPVGDHLAINHEVASGPFNPFIVTPNVLTVQEEAGDGASAKFTVKLAKQPRADVTVPITLDTNATKEITVSETTLTFTAENWSVGQEVTVTAKTDTTANDLKSVTVKLGTATSTDVRFNRQDPVDVVVGVLDKAS